MFSQLPERLTERLRIEGDRPANPSGEFILYWMHHALRGHENPALDIALLTAENLKLPVFVYQQLPELEPYASDRHHAFILQGARDMQRELSARGIGYALHLERAGQRGLHLKDISTRAAIVITEDLPTRPMNQLISRLTESVTTPIVLVDTACVVPIPLVGRAYDRAFAFRDATEKLRQARVRLPWVEQPDPAVNFIPENLPFEPVNLESTDLAGLIRACDIDHGIGPVPDTCGGSTAGYQRWEAFKTTRLAKYARDRNDALLDGASRMSAYLHYGMVSPLRIAREAAAIPGAGADKYLDELLIWRELAYAFCRYQPNHETMTAIPQWAVETLTQHERDERPILHDWETLSRGQTADALWNAAQRSLLLRGELHNNVRMTWGKALLHWTASAAEALRLMIDLNHRYALDGRDPASYGGILWCLGQFDRPFFPPKPIFGTVRTRPAEEHAARLDSRKYSAKVTRPWKAPVPRVAVVGAGLSGLMCARTLADQGLDVTVFEKSRGPGGRMATRRVEPNLQFDHGAQYFTARDRNFVRHVQAWIQQGFVEEWVGRFVEIEGTNVRPRTDPPKRYVGMPNMRAVAGHLADDLSIRPETKIVRIEHNEASWELTDDAHAKYGSFDYLVVSVPAPQAAGLLSDHPLASEARAVPMSPCWAVMAAFESPVQSPWDAALVTGSSLAWVARNSSKPGRDSEDDSWVLHGSTDWSTAHRESTSEVAAELLLKEFANLTSAKLPSIVHLDAHRWLYSATPLMLDRHALFDADAGLAVCGDWLAGGRVQGAFKSGVAAAGCILRKIGIVSNPTAAASLFPKGSGQ